MRYKDLFTNKRYDVGVVFEIPQEHIELLQRVWRREIDEYETRKKLKEYYLTHNATVCMNYDARQNSTIFEGLEKLKNDYEAIIIQSDDRRCLVIYVAEEEFNKYFKAKQ